MGTEDQFTVETVGRTLIIEPGSRVGALAGGDFAERRRQLVERIRNSNPDALVLDFRNVEILGSMLLDTLCVVWKCIRQRSGRLLLCNLSEFAYDVLKVSRLNRLWPVYATREEALDALRSKHGTSGVDADTVELHTPECERGSDWLRIVEKGVHTVVRFDRGDLPPEHADRRNLDQISQLVEDSHCRDLRFDMTGISSAPSGFLGVVTGLAQRGVDVSVCNPSREVREVFELANLERFLHARGAARVVGPARVEDVQTSPRRPDESAKSEWMGTLFAIDRVPGALIVSLSASRTFSSAQLQAEAFALRRKLSGPTVLHLVIDLGGIDYIGSEVIGVLISLARTVKDVGGRAVFCRISSNVAEMLQKVGLLRAWPHFSTRDEAVQAVCQP